MPTGYNVNWNDEWIVENYLSYPSYQKMVEAHNELFGTDAGYQALKNHARLKLGLKKPRKHEVYTDEQIAWLKENYPKYGSRKTAELFNEKFNQNRSYSAIKNFGALFCDNVDINVANQNRVRATHSKGPRKIRPAGSTRMECGRLVMKTEDGRWDSAGKAIWEKEHGPVPEGYAILYLDRDQNNYSLDNLVAVPWKYLGLLNFHNLLSEHPEITKTGILWCDLHELLEEESCAK